MDNLFFGGFIESSRPNFGFISIINGLTDVDTTYNIIYEAVLNNPTYVILSEADTDHKIKVISKMIKHFEEKEDYEKCAELLRLKKAIQE